MVWCGSCLVLWHLIGWCNLNQAAGSRKALSGHSAKLIDRWYGLREMIDWLRLVRWQTMQGIAHEGAALSVTIMPDCLFFSHLLTHLSIPFFGAMHAAIYEHSQTQGPIQTNAHKQNFCATHTWNVCFNSKKEICSFSCSPLSPIKSFSTSPELWWIHQIALFFVTTHLHVCLCMHVCGCSNFCNPAHNVQSGAANVPRASHAYYSYYCWFWKISRQDIPLRLQRLSSSTSNTSQIHLKHHTASISWRTLFQGINQGWCFLKRNVDVLVFLCFW